MAKFVTLATGAALIGTGLFLEFVTLGASTPLTAFLISAGIGMAISGIGTLLTKGALATGSTATRSSVAPWNVVYGRARIGGILIYFGEFVYNPTPWYDILLDITVPVIALLADLLSSDNYWLDMVFVVACHPCESIDGLLFDGQRIQMSVTGGGSFNVNGAAGDSFTPVQQNVNIVSISRANNVVTVVLAANIPLLQVGDNISVQNVSGDYSLNGTYPVEQIISQVVGGPGSITFTYLCGGAPAIVDNEGQCLTTWPDYGNKVHMEVLLGTHTSTFPGMLHGTPYDGDSGNIVPYQQNPWTAAHLCSGRTVVFLRLHYSDQYFASGLPGISFLVSGKNDISDPRTSPATVGFSDNPALCIADYLTNVPFGFKAPWGTEVPYPQLIAAANMCDEGVPLAAGGLEPRYRLDGTFPLSMKRGEVLQNLLTSCGGRLTFTNGQFAIQPAGWPGVVFQLGPPTGIPSIIASATLSVISSFTGLPGGHFVDGSTGLVFAMFYMGAIGVIFGSAPWQASQGPWTERTDTHVMSPDEIVALQNGSCHAQFDIEVTGWGTAAAPVVLDIFETWIDVVFTDGTTAVFQPYFVNPVTGSGTITNPQNAVDGNPTTYCTITETVFASGADSCILQLGSYAALSSPLASPVPGEAGVAATSHALSHASGPLRWRPKVSIRDLYNGCKGTYISPINKWQSSDFPPYAQDTDHGYASGSPLYPFGDANLAADGGDRRWLDIQLPFTISVSMAQRLAKIELIRRRQQGTGTFAYNLALYQATALDVIQMTLPLLGWSNKLLEIAAFRFTLDKVNAGGKDVTLLGTQIDLQETDPSVYAWSISEELSPEGYQQAAMPTNVGVTGAGTLADIYTVNGT
jgi:hypothetical protein